LKKANLAVDEELEQKLVILSKRGKEVRVELHNLMVNVGYTSSHNVKNTMRHNIIST